MLLIRRNVLWYRGNPNRIRWLVKGREVVCLGGKKNIRAQCARCRPIVYSASAAIFHQVVSYVLFPRSGPPISHPRQERGRASSSVYEFRSRWTDLLLPSKELTFHRKELTFAIVANSDRTRLICARINRHCETRWRK